MASHGIMILPLYLLCFIWSTVVRIIYGEMSCPSHSSETFVPCHSGQRDHVWTETECESVNCCWLSSIDQGLACYQKECSAGYFGSQCQFHCRCLGSVLCDKVTGHCPAGCPHNRWGIGCLLENNCTYNDPTGSSYMGKKYTTVSNKRCVDWSNQRAYPANQFPDGDYSEALNYCRNPRPHEDQTWCYWSGRRWDFCLLETCDCPLGRFDVNCQRECHCSDVSEQCNQLYGQCQSGCHPHWTGPYCQECADGYFGSQCEYECHCVETADICDKSTGQCQYGCAAGWSGTHCQTACDVGFFGVGCELVCNCQSPLERCHPVTGDCSSNCRTGYAGPGCQLQLPMMTRMPYVRMRNGSAVMVWWRDYSNPPDRGSGPVSAYVVYYRRRRERDWEALRQTRLKMAAVTGLQQDTDYEFQVAAVHQSGIVGIPSPILRVSTCGRPTSGPANINIRPVSTGVSRSRGTTHDISGNDDGDDDVAVSTNDINGITLMINWNLPSRDKYNCVSIRRFRVYKKRHLASGDHRYQLLQSVYMPQARLTNVNQYKNLTIGVSLVNNAELESDVTDHVFVGKSGRVVSLQVSAESFDSLLVRWLHPTDSNGRVEIYLLRYRLVGVGDCQSQDAPGRWSRLLDIDSDQLQTVIKDLLPYSRYQVKVWARTSAGRGQVAMTYATTAATVPGSISDLDIVLLTSKSVVLSWTELDCQQRNGPTVGYFYQLTQQQSDSVDHLQTPHDVDTPRSAQTSHYDRNVVHRQVVNDTQLALSGLVPFSRYTFGVSFRNSDFGGPKTFINFTTDEDVPSSPGSIAVESVDVTSTLLSWQLPHPTYGVITGYSVGHYKSSRGRPRSDDDVDDGDMTILEVDEPSSLRYNVTDLQPYTTYQLQVRAYTKVGHGPWSDAVEATTPESIPSEPLNFVNKSRTSSTIDFEWLAPLHHNGILQSYEISCFPATAFGRRMADSSSAFMSRVNKTVSAFMRQYSVTRLAPGICYLCSLRASTRCGFGLPTSRLVWTRPAVAQIKSSPKVKLVKVMENMLAVSFQRAEPANSAEDADSLYRVIVEKLTMRQRRDVLSSLQPCGLADSELMEYSTASRHGVACYIAAEIVNVDDQDDQPFIVGDAKTYGGFYNAPLEHGRNYRVWLGFIVTVDGATATSYAVSMSAVVGGGPERIQVNTQSPASAADSDQTGLIIGITVAMVMTLLIIVIIISFIFYRRAARSKKTAADGTKSISGAVVTSNSDDEICDVTDDVSECQAEVLPLVGERPIRTAMAMEHRQIAVGDLWSYVADKKLSSTDSLKDEYNTLPQGLLFACDVARKSENRSKNRYTNIIAYDHSRVVLHSFDNPDSNYINANYIDGYQKRAAFVATQGPSKATSSDLWHMAWQLHSCRIIMLANLTEDGRRKCEQYWPETGSETFGDMSVEHVVTEQFADFKIRTFRLNKDGLSTTLLHLHFTAWPDHGVPMQPTSLLAFHRKFRSYDSESSAGPDIIHCSAGVGRTGTFIALDYLLEQAKAEGVVDIFYCVRQMRQARVNMIQTQEQYVFVYDALLEALAIGDTAVPCSLYMHRYAELRRVNPSTGKSQLHEEFEMLSSVTESESDVDTSQLDALRPHDVAKNRFTHIVPLSRFSRPYLLTANAGSTDYINAVFIDGYKKRDAFIVTQMPLPDTVVDFWTMIHDHSCRSIVMINNLYSCSYTDDTEVGVYFPVDVGHVDHYGSLSVKLMSVDLVSHSDIVIRDFFLSLNKKQTARNPGGNSGGVVVRQFQFTGWPEEAAVPSGRGAGLLSLLELLESWQQRSGNEPITVHCMDGAQRSGLVCALSYVIERLKVEQDVDVFQSVKHIRINRPQLIPTFEQYELLYDVVVDYLDCFATYSNFK